MEQAERRITVRLNPLSADIFRQLAMPASDRLDIIDMKLRHLEALAGFMMESRIMDGEVGDAVEGLLDIVAGCRVLCNLDREVRQ